MNDSYIIFGAPQIGEEEIAEVVATLRSGWIGTGPRVQAFEEAFRQYTGAAHAVAVNSCTAAMHLSLIAAGLGPGDTVVTTPMTFPATANVILHVGATPVFVDVDRATGNLRPEAVAAMLTPNSKAVMPVHMAGRPLDLSGFRALADRHGLLLIVDSAHCVEGRIDGRSTGSLADFSCYSFYPTKNLTTGEGGMVTTSGAEWAESVRRCRLHGLDRDAWNRYSDKDVGSYQVRTPGFKYNMTDLQAALGIHQLARLEASLARREAIWERYDQAFAGLPVNLPEPPEAGTRHARHLYTLLVDKERAGIDRDSFRERLHERGVGTGVHFLAVHLHAYYQERFGFVADDFPNATWISQRTVSLPLSARLSDAEVERVIQAVREALPAAGS